MSSCCTAPGGFCAARGSPGIAPGRGPPGTPGPAPPGAPGAPFCMACACAICFSRLACMESMCRAMCVLNNPAGSPLGPAARMCFCRCSGSLSASCTCTSMPLCRISFSTSASMVNILRSSMRIFEANSGPQAFSANRSINGVKSKRRPLSKAAGMPFITFIEAICC